MTLPSGIDESKISAEVDNGMMEITVRGGAATAEPHRIEVKEGTIYRLPSRPSSLTRGER